MADDGSGTGADALAGPIPNKAHQRGVRQHNLALVLRVLCQEGPRSRAAIAARTGLTKATVSSLVADLFAEGLVVEGRTAETGRPGRPGRPIGINDRRLVLGLQIDTDRVAASAVDLTGLVVERRVTRCDNVEISPERVVERLCATISDLLDELDAGGRRAVAASLGLPGIVDRHEHRVIVAANLGWNDVRVGERIADRLGIRVEVENEANLAALAELRLGSGRRWLDFVLVSAGSGLGAGVVIDGTVYRGGHGFGGELGHMVLDPAGPACPCGRRGCLERYVGIDCLPSVIRATGGDWPREVVRRAEAGDVPVLGALEELGDRLGQGLVGVVNLLDPEAVVLGGYLAPLAPWVVGPVHARLNQEGLGSRWTGYEVMAGALGDDAVLMGAAVHSIERVLEDPLVEGAVRTAG